MKRSWVLNALLLSACATPRTTPHPPPDMVVRCGSAWKKDPGSGVIGVEKGPLIPVV